ncbi:endoplasmic reticulum aminopeptidase 1-like [Paramuricea clavata]|uniref:Endoplasmic reticulum aminopeptidase 1-like n=1 Tax=Paramuricea clavata TaxID=317549 RepID=A0A6S7JDI2_PARCT|nr:endoplasmic reticulum aminopeptidase 1-like [Paramuricea clavata]
METSDDEQGQKPLLFSTEEPRPKESGVVGVLKAKKWVVVFAFAGVLAIAIIVGFVATKSSHSGCSSYADSEKCFFTGEIRLPTVLKPLTYKVRLHPNLTTFKFDGSVTIVVQALDDTNRIVFHQKGLNFSKEDISIYGVLKNGSPNKGKSIAVRELRFDPKDEQVIIKTAVDLQKNGEYAIEITKFKGNLNEKLEGFYKSSYKNKAGKIR